MTNKYTIGDKWYGLTLVRVVDKEDIKNPDGKREGLFTCSCGESCQKIISSVRLGRIKSCGGPKHRKLKTKRIAKKQDRLDKKSPCPVCGKLKTKSAKLCRSCRTSATRENPDFKTRVEYAAEWNRMKKYGIDSGGYDLLLVIAKNNCNICGCELTLPIQAKGQPLSTAVIDHNHETGNLRGLLCNACNKGIGLLKDSPEIIYNAWRWVKND